MSTTNNTDGQFSSRKEREDNIRSHSESYGSRWCSDNATNLFKCITDFKDGKKTDASNVKVRIYNRVDNKMSEIPLSTLLENITFDKKDVPARLRPTPFGQVIISPDMHVSSVIYYLLTSIWVASKPGDNQ